MAAPVIDTHTHLLDAGHWPPAWWDHVAHQWAAAQEGRLPEDVRSRIEPGLIDPDGARMVDRMDDAGVTTSVILPIDWGPDYQTWESIRSANDHAARMAEEHPGRFTVFLGIDPRRPGALDYVQSHVDSGAVQGLKLYPACGWHPTSGDAMALYELAEAAGLPLLFHTGDPLPILDRELCDPSLLVPALERFPALKVWLGHAGAPAWWEEACTAADASENVKLEMSVWLWDDSGPDGIAHWERLMGQAASRFGTTRILFGSDHVSGQKVRGDRFLGTIVDAYRGLAGRECGGFLFTSEDVDRIMGLNALHDLSPESGRR